MGIVKRLWAIALVVGVGAAQTEPPASWNDEALWRDFCAWTEALKPLPPGEKANSTQLYEKRLVALGASAKGAAALILRLHAYRRGKPERERIYWSARFKLGGGPDQPLRLLAEVVRDREPGAALDVAMGRGRNGIYLASLGWDVTGYDLSPDAVAVAERNAAETGVRLRGVEASHDTFDFGEEQWDLIVCAYAYMQPHQPKWPERLWKALKPGGTVVIQTWWKRQASLEQLMDHWREFRIVRYEDLDAGAEADEWGPSKTNPTVRLVLRKDARRAEEKKKRGERGEALAACLY